tara:strand:- start:192 stop:524 length:333 start_codon:yes stop_codon:yes gene_type:complete
MAKDFPCTSCGLCCQNLSEMHTTHYEQHSPIVQFLIDKFPYKISEEGVCEKFVDGQCSVYNDRPIVCNVRLGGIIQGLDQQEWYEQVAVGCNIMIKEAGLDEKYLVSMEK